MTSKSDEPLFRATSFQGVISGNEFEHEVKFEIHVRSDGRLQIEPLGVGSAVYVSLSKCMGRPGGHSEAVSLKGKSVDGIIFESEDVAIAGAGTKSDGFEIKLSAVVASISIPRKEELSDNPAAIKYRLRGFKSFRAKPVNAVLGEVLVRGGIKIESADDISGEISVRSHESHPDSGWYADADALAKFVWTGMEFGHGGRLQIPIVEVFHRDKVVVTLYAGSGQPSHLASIHTLDQSDFIAALVSRCESDDEFPDSIWQVVGWLNNDSTIDEVRFLTLMTAIETILRDLVPEAPSTLIPKSKFKAIRENLVGALDSHDLDDEQREVLKGNIYGINRAPLSTKLRAVILKYDLPSDAFDNTLIKRLNKQRISIVHSGKSIEDEDLWECILFAREIVTLIVFAELRYKGRYQHFAGGHEQRSLS